jgi:hypothetical protein
VAVYESYLRDATSAAAFRKLTEGYTPLNGGAAPGFDQAIEGRFKLRLS